MSDVVVTLFVIVFMAICYGAGRLHQWIIEVEQERQKKKRNPNWMLAGLEDAQAIDTDVLLWIRDALKVVEGRLDDRMHVLGQIRNGEYDKDRPSDAQ